jgi:hypothetical protein
MALASAMGDAFRPMPLKNAAIVRGVCFEIVEVCNLGEVLSPSNA